jgi:RNA polymerase sigma factor (sigma-70 family)
MTALQLHYLLEAIRLPGTELTPAHDDAIRAFAPELTRTARYTLMGFRMPINSSVVEVACQQWWALVKRDGLLSLKPHYGFSKYKWLFMTRAVGRIADRRGTHRARPMKESEGIGLNAQTLAETVARIPDKPARRRIQPIQDAVDVCSKAPTPLEHFQQLQSAEEVRAEISRLEATLREPVKCVFYDGLSIKQTGAKLGLTPNAVAGRLFRARGILRRRLERFRE